MRSYFSFSILFSLSPPLFNCCGCFDTCYKGFFPSVSPEKLKAKYNVGIAKKGEEIVFLFVDKVTNKTFFSLAQKKGQTHLSPFRQFCQNFPRFEKPNWKRGERNKGILQTSFSPAQFFPLSFPFFQPTSKKTEWDQERKKERGKRRKGWVEKKNKKKSRLLPSYIKGLFDQGGCVDSDSLLLFSYPPFLRVSSNPPPPKKNPSVSYLTSKRERDSFLGSSVIFCPLPPTTHQQRMENGSLIYLLSSLSWWRRRRESGIKV